MTDLTLLSGRQDGNVQPKNRFIRSSASETVETGTAERG